MAKLVKIILEQELFRDGFKKAGTELEVPASQVDEWEKTKRIKFRRANGETDNKKDNQGGSEKAAASGAAGVPVKD